MAKVIDIKTKSRTFGDWLEEVIDTNELRNNNKIPNAMIIWEKTNDEGNTTLTHARFNVDTDELDWYIRCMQEQLYEWKLEEYLIANIDKFIQYIE